MDIQELMSRFESLYGHPAVGACSAPGRVNLIGEHTDYNGGFVLPIAIERRTVALYSPREDDVVNFSSLQAGEYGLSVHLGQTIVPMEMPKWANYCKGVLAALREKGLKLRGANLLMDSDVPLGGGLSSSASLEVATAWALLDVAGLQGVLSDGELAALCQKAENVYAGAPCGIMDQSIAVMGQAGQALLLDCRSGQTRHIPFSDPNLVLLVADTQVKHSIGDGGYPARRKQCHDAAAKLGVAMLRDATMPDLELRHQDGTLTAKEFARARHVVGEIARTLSAVEALGAADYQEFGRLMLASHASLRDDFEVSCEELDAIVDAAGGCDGVFGARMTGGGFGGCAIVLVQADYAREAEQTIIRAFERQFGRPCPVFQTRAADGAGPMNLS
jgi:galactokinase